MPWRVVFVGGLGLIALQVAVSNPDTPARLRSGLGKLGDLVRSAADPSIPAIPDLRSAAAGDGDGDDDGLLPDWLDPSLPIDPSGPLDLPGPYI